MPDGRRARNLCFAIAFGLRILPQSRCGSGTLGVFTLSVSKAATCLAAARSRSGSDSHLGCHSIPSRRFATRSERLYSHAVPLPSRKEPFATHRARLFLALFRCLTLEGLTTRRFTARMKAWLNIRAKQRHKSAELKSRLIQEQKTQTTHKCREMTIIVCVLYIKFRFPKIRDNGRCRKHPCEF